MIPGRAARPLLTTASFVPAILLLILLLSCGPEDASPDKDDGGPVASIAGNLDRGGPEVWLLGRAIREECRLGFLLVRSRGVWEVRYLDLPFASVWMHALAAPPAGDPWLAGEGLASLDSQSFIPFLYRVTTGGLVEVPAPPLELAVTAICPYADGTAWIVGAGRDAGQLYGYAAFWDGAVWLEHTPEVEPTVQRWNLSAADFPEPGEGAALGLVSDTGTGEGILGCVFLYEQGLWTRIEPPFDPARDVYIFTDVRRLPAGVLVAGRANLRGWIGRWDAAGAAWILEDLSAFAELSPMWEIDSIAEDGAGVRWAVGSLDVAGFQEPLVLRDRGAGWERVNLPDVQLVPGDHEQARRAVFPAPDLGFLWIREYYYNSAEGVYRDSDNLLATDGNLWEPVALPITEPRYEFQAIVQVPVR